MKGYKAFNHDWTCRNNFQYQIGKIYRMNEEEIKLCKKGFHFCQVPTDVLKYYENDDCKYAEIFASGKILEDGDKCVCNQIEIIKELSLKQIEELSSGLFIKNDGTKRSYLNGKLHRLDGPAIEDCCGSKYWYLNGELHRLDGPTIEYANGDKEWYFQGKRHRVDGPAIEYTDGNKFWYFKDQLHRENGPAVEYSNGRKEWWLDGTLSFRWSSN
jgi:hypothetical protein